MAKSKTGIFTASPDVENSLTISRTGIPSLQIGFISNDGEFYIASDNEQVLIHPEDLIELFNFVQLLVNTPRFS